MFILSLPCTFVLTPFSLLFLLFLSFSYYPPFLSFFPLPQISFLHYSFVIYSHFIITALLHLCPFPYRYCHCVLTQGTFCSVLWGKEVQGRSSPISDGSVSDPSVPSLQPNSRGVRFVNS